MAEESGRAMEEANSRIHSKQELISTLEARLEAPTGNSLSPTHCDTTIERPRRRSYVRALDLMKVPETPPQNAAVLVEVTNLPDSVDSPRHSSGFFEQMTGSAGSQNSGLRILARDSTDDTPKQEAPTFPRGLPQQSFDVRESPRFAVYSPKPSWMRSSKIHPGLMDETASCNVSYSHFTPAASSTILPDPTAPDHRMSLLKQVVQASKINSDIETAGPNKGSKIMAKHTKSSLLRMQAKAAASTSTKDKSDVKSPNNRSHNTGKSGSSPFKFLARASRSRDISTTTVRTAQDVQRRLSRERRAGKKATISSILKRRSYQTRNKSAKKPP